MSSWKKASPVLGAALSVVLESRIADRLASISTCSWSESLEQKINAYLEVLKMMEVVEWLENQPPDPKSSPCDHLN